LLERIAMRDAAFRREGELGDHVKYLLALGHNR
jgi:hypothetical protein